MITNQDKIFLSGEGDEWYRRNSAALTSEHLLDWPLTIIDRNKLRPKTILEVGASNGWRLAELHKRLGSECVGIEPSEAAIVSGQKSFPFINFTRATAATMEGVGAAEVVIVNFVLHWVARENLSLSIAKIDASVADEGYLIIGDFLPDRPCRTPYHHLPGENVFTFKQDYAKIFISTGLYTEVERVVFRHSDHSLGDNVPENERAVCVLLQKSFQKNYVLSSSPAKPHSP